MTSTESIRGIIYKDQPYWIPSHMNYGKNAIDRMLRAKDKVALVKYKCVDRNSSLINEDVLLINTVFDVKD